MTQSAAPPRAYPEVLQIRLPPALDDELLLEMGALNSELRMERTTEGVLEIMPPTGWGTTHRNAVLTALFVNWAQQDGTGEVSDSSGGFVLPNGAVRSPDVAWVLRSRLEALSPQYVDKFLPLCPDFVIELRSPSDTLRRLQEKLEEYIANGARLGWLIDPEERKVYVYQPGSPVERLDAPSELSGDPVLPGFILDLTKVWGEEPRTKETPN